MIYYVEDDTNIRDLVVYTLNNSGFEARGFKDAQEFYEACDTTPPSLVLLDIMLPGDNGLTILKTLKSDTRTKAIPVIMLTARGTEYDKVVGLDLGADDYVAKPFGMMELVARVRARLRRTDTPSASEELRVGELVVNRQKHTVTGGGQKITLTLKEFELLCLLMEHVGMAFTREQILEAVWQYSYEGSTRTVDVHMTTLRQKLGEYGNRIETVRGVGYRFGE